MGDCGTGFLLSPTVLFTQPQVDNVSSSLGVVVEASDLNASLIDGTIDEVLLYINDTTFIRSDGTAPYEWGTASADNNDPALLNLPPGAYWLRAVAIDNDGNSASATLSVTVEGSGK
jgi:hypothetical protein